MKKSNFSKRIKALALAGSAAILIAGVVVVNGCKKENTNAQVKQTVVDDESEAMLAHILAFKERMAYYHENPNLKTGGQLYSASEAVIELESLLNFNFCYTDNQYNKKEYVTSEIIMPLDDLEKINDPKLMEVYYERVIDTIQAQMGRVNFPNMKLLMVDLDVSDMDSNGDAIVSIGALIGNSGPIPISNEVGWWFGNDVGDCSEVQPNPYEGIDAALEIENEVLNTMFPAPPPGKIRKKTNIVSNLEIVSPWDYWLKPEAQRNNYKDSKLFHAIEDYGAIDDDVCCVSIDNEMLFYPPQYTDIINSEEEDYNNSHGTAYVFTNCIVYDHQLIDQFTGEYTKIWHTMQIFLGHVTLVNTYDWPVEDITTYEQ